MAGQFAARIQWSTLLRGGAVAFATLAVAAFAFAARADALIYWANANTHTIGFATFDTKIVDQNFIHVAGGSPNGVAVYGDFVYWTVPGANAIGRAGMNGTGVNQTFIQGLQGPSGVAVNGAGIFWTNTGSGTIGRANLDGTGVNQNFITGASPSNLMAADADHLYWTVLGGQFGLDSIARADVSGGNLNTTFITGDAVNTPEGVAAEPLIAAPTPPPRIADLIAEVTGAGLPHGTERSLLAKLDNAQRKVDAGQIAVACNGLGAYLNEVRAQNGKKLQAANAQDLIDTARAVQDALGCGTT